MASEGLVGTQGAETAPLSSVVHTPTQDSTASTPIQPMGGGAILFHRSLTLRGTVHR